MNSGHVVRTLNRWNTLAHCSAFFVKSTNLIFKGRHYTISPKPSRLCIGLLDMRPHFKPQVRYNEI